MVEVSGVRRFGAASLDLAWVAAGRYDAFWERGLAPWDLAAGIVIVREAGGLVSDLADGQDMLGNGTVLATNGQLHGRMLKVLKSA
jgi:myo-inositol-1(or 4)-monophosphatase